MTARMPLSSVASSLLCLEKQNYMRSRCTNSTQDIQYPHAGIYFREDAAFRDRQRRTPPLGIMPERKSYREAIYSFTNRKL